ncbi:TetR/AcrR family transcriptional regulator [Acetobacter persici]|uniref:TetR family transcriptional regulator n=1 Tax=Acetobacter persici TaxID=1076596 RepID=A0A6V8I8Z8_9PROT|nr:TetR/AcrR family transcriptional regulator [Acetobacter persici]GFE93066.1 TetR family transcriptional regulator [Acetobacter persici]
MTKPDAASHLDMAHPCLEGKKRRCGRPTPYGTEQLDQHLLEVAASLFVKHGYAGTSVDQIARKASASKQTLYRRYPSKEELFKAVITNVTACLLRTMAETPLKDPLQELKTISRLMLDFVLRPDALGTYRILISDAYRYPSLIDHAIENINKPFHANFLRLLKAAEAAGQIGAGHADSTTTHLWAGMLTGWPMKQSLFGLNPLEDDAARDAFFEQAWALFLKGVGAAPA